MSSKEKEKKSKSKAKTKELKRKETDKSHKSVKSSKSPKSNKTKSEKSGKKSSNKDGSKSRSKSKTPKKGKEVTPTDEENKKMDTRNMTSVQVSPSTDQGNSQGMGLSPNTGNIHTINNSFDKCDGCFDVDAIVYCKECEKSYCSLCESQIHLVPANRNHERIAITEMSHLRRYCYHHNNPLKLYCDSCDEPICHECQVLGPHNTKLHRIDNIVDIYKKKYQSMNDVIQVNLIKKCEVLTNNLQLIDDKINEIQLKSKSIEREIKRVYENMINHLKSEEGKRTAMLNYESAIIQKELVQIGEIINYIRDSNDNSDVLGFLLRFKQFNEKIESLLSKEFMFEIDNDITELPNDLDLQNNLKDSYEKVKKLIKVKDDIIWNLLQGNGNGNGNNSNNNKSNIQSSNGKFELSSSYAKTPNNTKISNSQPNNELAKTIATKIKKSNINFYQLLCEQDNEGKQYINRKGLLKALKRLNVNMEDSDLDGLLKALNIKEATNIPVKEISLNLSKFNS